jgi:hypothetical protein
MAEITEILFETAGGVAAPFTATVNLVRHVGTDATVDGIEWDLADSRGKGAAAGIKITARTAAKLVGGTWSYMAGDAPIFGGIIEASEKSPRSRDRVEIGRGNGPVSGERRAISAAVQVRNGRLYLNLTMPKLDVETGLDWDDEDAFVEFLNEIDEG